MKWKDMPTSLTVLAILFAIGLLAPNQVFAHCDGMDGPVINAAQKALETGNGNLVLIWVQKQDEAEIKEAFQKTLAVRQLSPEAKELAECPTPSHSSRETMDTKHLQRLPIMVLAMAALLTGVWTGLLRLGWDITPLRSWRTVHRRRRSLGSGKVTRLAVA